MGGSSSAREPRSQVRWSVAVELAGGLVVAAYFVLAGIGVQATFGGGLVSPHDRSRASALTGAAGACLVLTIVAAGLVGLLAGYIGDRRSATGTSSYPYAALLLCSWTVGFAVALLGASLFVGNDSKPMAFGWIWFIFGGVVGPALVAISGLRPSTVDV